MKPTKVLRDFLKISPQTYEFSSQAGLAKLTGHSDSLIRAIENGRMRVSPKFAKILSELTGASRSWLLEPDVQPGVVPAEDGGELQHKEVINRIQSAIKNNLKKADIHLKKTEEIVNLSNENQINADQNEFKRITARTLAKAVEVIIYKQMFDGNFSFMNKLNILIDEEDFK